MDIMQLAGELSLRHSASVTGPERREIREGVTETVVQVILPSRLGVGIIHYTGQPPAHLGELNVFGIRETGDRLDPVPTVAWGECSPVLPDSREPDVTVDRVREIVTALAGLGK